MTLTVASSGEGQRKNALVRTIKRTSGLEAPIVALGGAHGVSASSNESVSSSEGWLFSSQYYIGIIDRDTSRMISIPASAAGPPSLPSPAHPCSFVSLFALYSARLLRLVPLLYPLHRTSQSPS